MYEALENVTEQCINSWLPKAQLLVKYGASPHILISGEVGTDGNLRSDLKCEMHCSEKAGEGDCWDVWTYEKIGSFFSWGERPEITRKYMLTKAKEAYGVDFSEESDEVLLRKCQAIPYYQTLGVKPGASPAEFKKAYRTLSLKYHPDKVVGYEDRFRLVQQAYEKLKDLNNILSDSSDDDIEFSDASNASNTVETSESDPSDDNEPETFRPHDEL